MGHKRSWHEAQVSSAAKQQMGMGQTVSMLKNAQTATTEEEQPREDRTRSEDDGEPWQEVSHKGKKKRRKDPERGTSSYPQLNHSPNARLQSNVKISDLQALALYILSEGSAPQWISVRHHNSIKKVVVLMIPGLEPSMFSALNTGHFAGKNPLVDVIEITGSTSEDQTVPGAAQLQGSRDSIATNETKSANAPQKN
ncbi:hypothetical protein FKW77_010579 [Venturia effusa]|uniref:Uncharacterized protein n=1 Tax=Venturia effusa TaxID=50376 RepID=A0A517KXV7_9PEZI|nr:hypothetical protein FKW77_010579 [Venturia effusa]